MYDKNNYEHFKLFNLYAEYINVKYKINTKII